MDEWEQRVLKIGSTAELSVGLWTCQACSFLNSCAGNVCVQCSTKKKLSLEESLKEGAKDFAAEDSEVIRESHEQQALKQWQKLLLKCGKVSQTESNIS